MVSFYDFFEVFLATQPKHWIVNALASDGDGPADYPISIYDLNGNNIGTAVNKQDFIDQWNANPVNNSAGLLTGWYGPFSFEFIAKENVNLKADSQSESDFVIDSDGEVIVDSDDIYITN